MHSASLLLRVRRALRTRAFLPLAATAVLAAHPGAARAQSPRDSAARAASPLFTATDLWVGAGFAAATVALFPLDERMAKRLQNEEGRENRFIDRTATGFEFLGSTGPYIIGGTLYAVGMLGHHPQIADLGWHGVESAVVASGITMLLKGTLGRSRPFVSSDTNPRDFRFGSGFGDGNRQSFPSGHTTSAFAVAASVTAEARRHWPDRWWSTWGVGTTLYGGATMVGLARMYHNKHWASDVALGAAVGTFSGRKVVQYNHDHPGNAIDRLILRTSVIPSADGRGLALAWTVPAPF